MAEDGPLSVENGELYLKFALILPGWLFDKNDQVQFNFLGSIPISYHNPRRVDTWKEAPKKTTIYFADGEHFDFNHPAISALCAEVVRERAMKWVDVYLQNRSV